MRGCGVRGLSLIEVMVCLAILMIGAAGLIRLHVEMLRVQRTCFQQSKALALAQGKLDELRYFRSLHHQADGSPAYEDIRRDQGGVLLAGAHDDGTLQLNWRVADGPAAPEWSQLPAYKQVEVVVIWRDGKQNSQRLSLQGIITPYAQATVHELGFDGAKP